MPTLDKKEMTMTLNEKAERLAGAFVLCTVQEGNHTRLCINEDHEDAEIVRHMVRDAHEELGFDFSYRAVYTLLEALSETSYESIDDPSAYELVEPDVYTSDLVAWLGENIHHVVFCDQALTLDGVYDSIEAIIAEGQMLAYSSALAAIRTHWENQTDAD